MTVIEQMRPSAVNRFARVRSKVTNGRRQFVADGDGNSAWARRWRDLTGMHLDDLTGGQERASAAQYALCQRAATFQIELEALEARLSTGMDIDLDLYGRLSGHLRRILETLGSWQRAATGAPQGRPAHSRQIEEEWPPATDGGNVEGE